MTSLKIARCEVCGKPAPWDSVPVLCWACQAKAEDVFGLTGRTGEDRAG